MTDFHGGCLIKLKEQVRLLGSCLLLGGGSLLLPPVFTGHEPQSCPVWGTSDKIFHISFNLGQRKENSSQRPVTVHWKQGTRVRNYYQKSDLFLPLKKSPGKIDLISQCRWEGGLEPVFVFFFLIIREKKSYVLGFGFHQRQIYKFIISRISQ